MDITALDTRIILVERPTRQRTALEEKALQKGILEGKQKWRKMRKNKSFQFWKGKEDDIFMKCDAIR